MNTKLHAIIDTRGRPVRFFITAGQVSDYTGAAALMNGLPEADWLLADREYDADWFQEGPIDKVMHPCILGFLGVNYARQPLNTTRGATNDAIVSSACSAG